MVDACGYSSVSPLRNFGSGFAWMLSNEDGVVANKVHGGNIADKVMTHFS